jgi:hypothetical protein
LPKRVDEHRTSGSRAWIQKTYPEDSPTLLCLGRRARRKEHRGKREADDILADY